MRSLPGCRLSQRGFTLLELMLVILIIGLMVGTVSLALPDSKAQELQKQASRLHAQVNLASQTSVFKNKDIGLKISRLSYDFYQFEGDHWTLLEPQSRFSSRSLPPGTSFELSLDGQLINIEDPKKPQILFLSDGQMSSFRLSLLSKDQGNRFSLRGDLNGQTLLTESGPST
ncbi:MAG: general secretion pathway protein H [Motiliproteus sp.]|jgi:general secretion pathway protein H